MQDFEPINLDCCTVDPEELQSLSDVLGQLARYANLKACAMQSRLNGAIQNALAAEKRGDSIYNQLPEWAKW